MIKRCCRRYQKKALRPADRRNLVNWATQVYKVSMRRASAVTLTHRPLLYYKFRRADQAFLKKRIQEIAFNRAGYGYERIYTLLRREGWIVNHKRVHRLYCEMNLQLRAKQPKRKVSVSKRHFRPAFTQPNDCWIMDFVHDNIYEGKKLRILNIVDNFRKYCPAIGVGNTYKSTDVINTLDMVIERFGKPTRIQCDNGSEFVSKELDLWAYSNKIELDFSRPGKPTDNAFVESFNGSFGKNV